MEPKKLEDLDEMFSDKPSAPREDGPSLDALDPMFSEPVNRTEPKAAAPGEPFVSGRDMAVIGGAGAGYMLSAKQVRLANEIAKQQEIARQIEMRMKAQEMARLQSETPQMRPGAQPFGSASAQRMEPGAMTAGDKWASKIGGPGGETAQQAYANYRMRGNLAPGETLLRSGIALPPGVDVPGLAQESAKREVAAAKPSMMQRSAGPLMALSRMLGPNRFLGPLAGGMAGYEASESGEQSRSGNYIDAILSGLSALGGGAMATGYPPAQILGAALAGAPYAGRVMAPAGANMLESLFPLQTGFERPMTREQAMELMMRVRGL